MKKLSMALSLLSGAAMTLVLALLAPERMAYHFDYKGTPDLWGSKWIYLILAFIPLLLCLCFYLSERLSEKSGAEDNKKIQEKLIPLFPILFIAIGWIVLIPSMRPGETANTRQFALTIVLIGLTLAYVSNYSAKLRPNRVIGIRTRDTLSDPRVWKKTARIGGWLGVAGGLVMALSGALGMAFGSAWVWAAFGIPLGVLLGGVAPLIYSRRVAKKLKEGNPS